MKYKKYILIFLLIIVLSAFWYQKTKAAVPVAVPFGGPILISYECACSGGWFMLVFDQKTKLPVPMTFQFGLSMIRANYNIFTPTVQTLGSYTPGGICLMGSSSCFGFPTQGTITPTPLSGVGTGSI